MHLLVDADAAGTADPRRAGRAWASTTADIRPIAPSLEDVFVALTGKHVERRPHHERHLFRGFGAILYKEFIVVFRDRTTLFFMFFPPLLQIIAFGFALDNDVKHMAMVVFDEDRTVESRQLVDAFVNTQTFRVVKQVHSLEDLSAAVRRGQAYVGLEIPPDFTRKLHAGQKADVQVLIDGSNSTTALQALNTALGVALRRSVNVLLDEAGRRDLPVEVRPQVLYNPAMRAPNFFVPGVIGTALQIATVFAVAMSIVREREKRDAGTVCWSVRCRGGA